MAITNAETEALIQLLKKRLGLIKHFATLGDSDDLSNSIVDEPGRKGYVRCRFQNDDVPYHVVKSGLLGAYSPHPGSPVVVGYDEKGDLAIIKGDFDGIIEADGNPAIYNSGDQRMSAFNQTDGLLPLFSGAVSGTLGTLTNEVFVNSWRFVDDNTVRWFEGALIDLTAYVPGANLHRYIAIFLKFDDLSIEIGTSTPIATITPLQESDKQECYNGRSCETLPMWLYRLENSQTVVTNANKIEDLRPWLSTPKIYGFPNPITTIQKVCVRDTHQIDEPGLVVGGTLTVSGTAVFGDLEVSATGDIILEATGEIIVGSSATLSGYDPHVNIDVSDTPYSAGSEVYIFTNTSGGDITITLPSVNVSSDKEYTIKNTGTGTITIDPFGTETIDKSATLTVVTQFDAPKLKCDGVDWWIV